jgi:lipoprotein-anchoring transpeptidase ErfK/SrfK/tRNA(Arg) A34 adenosine deaminase TadA/phosphotransferase system HPr-like phosphotransfer protein
VLALPKSNDDLTSSPVESGRRALSLTEQIRRWPLPEELKESLLKVRVFTFKDFSFEMLWVKIQKLLAYKGDDDAKAKVRAAVYHAVMKMAEGVGRGEKGRGQVLGLAGEISGLYEAIIKRGTTLEGISLGIVQSVNPVFYDKRGMGKEFDAMSDNTVFEFKFHLTLRKFYQQVIGVSRMRKPHLQVLTQPRFSHIRNLVYFGEADAGYVVKAVEAFVKGRSRAERRRNASVDIVTNKGFAAKFSLNQMMDFLTSPTTLALAREEERSGRIRFLPEDYRHMKGVIQKKIDQLAGRKFDVIIGVSRHASSPVHSHPYVMLDKRELLRMSDYRSRRYNRMASIYCEAVIYAGFKSYASLIRRHARQYGPADYPGRFERMNCSVEKVFSRLEGRVLREQLDMLYGILVRSQRLEGKRGCCDLVNIALAGALRDLLGYDKVDLYINKGIYILDGLPPVNHLFIGVGYGSDDLVVDFMARQFRDFLPGVSRLLALSWRQSVASAPSSPVANETKGSVPFVSLDPVFSKQLSLPAWAGSFIEARRWNRYTTAREKMALAIGLSRVNVEENTGGPFGAAVFDSKNRSLVSIGVNRVIPENASMAHAEMMVLMLAQQLLGVYSLASLGRSFELVTSAQPCAVCFGAIPWSGVDALLIGARSKDVESIIGFDEGPVHQRWKREIEQRGIRVRRDVLRSRAVEVLKFYLRENGIIYNGKAILETSSSPILSSIKPPSASALYGIFRQAKQLILDNAGRWQRFMDPKNGRELVETCVLNIPDTFYSLARVVYGERELHRYRVYFLKSFMNVVLDMFGHAGFAVVICHELKHVLSFDSSVSLRLFVWLKNGKEGAGIKGYVSCAEAPRININTHPPMEERIARLRSMLQNESDSKCNISSSPIAPVKPNGADQPDSFVPLTGRAEKTCVVDNCDEVHEHDISNLVSLANRFSSRIYLVYKNDVADLKHILDSLSVVSGAVVDSWVRATEVKLIAEGEDAALAVATLAGFLSEGFPEAMLTSISKPASEKASQGASSPVKKEEELKIALSVISAFAYEDFSFDRLRNKIYRLLAYRGKNESIVQAAVYHAVSKMEGAVTRGRSGNGQLLGLAGEISGLYEAIIKRGTTLEGISLGIVQSVNPVFYDKRGMGKEFDAISDNTVFEFKFHLTLRKLYQQVIGTSKLRKPHLQVLIDPRFSHIRNIVYFGEADDGYVVKTVKAFMASGSGDRRGRLAQLIVSENKGFSVKFPLGQMKNFIHSDTTTAFAREEEKKHKAAFLPENYRHMDRIIDAKMKQLNGAKFDVIIGVSTVASSSPIREGLPSVEDITGLLSRENIPYFYAGIGDIAFAFLYPPDYVDQVDYLRKIRDHEAFSGEEREWFKGSASFGIFEDGKDFGDTADVMRREWALSKTRLFDLIRMPEAARGIVAVGRHAVDPHKTLLHEALHGLGIKGRSSLANEVLTDFSVLLFTPEGALGAIGLSYLGMASKDERGVLRKRYLDRFNPNHELDNIFRALREDIVGRNVIEAGKESIPIVNIFLREMFAPSSDVSRQELEKIFLDYLEGLSQKGAFGKISPLFPHWKSDRGSSPVDIKISGALGEDRIFFRNILDPAMTMELVLDKEIVESRGFFLYEIVSNGVPIRGNCFHVKADEKNRELDVPVIYTINRSGAHKTRGLGLSILEFLRREALRLGWTVSFTSLKDMEGDWLRKLIFTGYSAALRPWDGTELGQTVVGKPKGDNVSVAGISSPVNKPLAALCALAIYGSGMGFPAAPALAQQSAASEIRALSYGYVPPILEDAVIFYQVNEPVSVKDLSKKLNMTPQLLKSLNNLRSDTLAAGQAIKVLWLDYKIIVSRSDKRLYLCEANGRVLREYSVGVGKKNSKTPLGIFEVTERLERKAYWYKPRSDKKVPYGHKNYPFGKLGIFVRIGPSIGMHSTSWPGSIGKEESDGCIRMRDEDAQQIYNLVPIGTKVTIKEFFQAAQPPNASSPVTAQTGSFEERILYEGEKWSRSFRSGGKGRFRGHEFVTQCLTEVIGKSPALDSKEKAGLYVKAFEVLENAELVPGVSFWSAEKLGILLDHFLEMTNKELAEVLETSGKAVSSQLEKLGWKRAAFGNFEKAKSFIKEMLDQRLSHREIVDRTHEAGMRTWSGARWTVKSLQAYVDRGALPYVRGPYKKNGSSSPIINQRALVSEFKKQAHGNFTRRLGLFQEVFEHLAKPLASFEKVLFYFGIGAVTRIDPGTMSMAQVGNGLMWNKHFVNDGYDWNCFYYRDRCVFHAWVPKHARPGVRLAIGVGRQYEDWSEELGGLSDRGKKLLGKGFSLYCFFKELQMLLTTRAQLSEVSIDLDSVTRFFPERAESFYLNKVGGFVWPGLTRNLAQEEADYDRQADKGASASSPVLLQNESDWFCNIRGGLSRFCSLRI